MAIFITWIALSCQCYLMADAPSDDCPIHSGGIVDRCECGRFVAPAQNGGTRKRRFAAFCDRLDEPWR